MTETKTKPKKVRQRPTQDECMQWLHDNFPDLYLKATRERDWIWLRGSRGDHIFTGKTGKLKAYGFRAKQEGSHKLGDGTEAVWYHTCQGKWRPTYKKGTSQSGYYRKKKREDKKSMSKSDALKFVNNL